MIEDARIEATIREICDASAGPLCRGNDGERYVTVPADCLAKIVETLLDQDLLHHLTAITALDEGDSLGVLYHLWLESGLTLRVACARENPVLPSVSTILPAALWYEREVHDLFGIRFEGHRALEPLLISDEWDGPPPLLHEDQR